MVKYSHFAKNRESFPPRMFLRIIIMVFHSILTYIA